jgi:hypothetical protein
VEIITVHVVPIDDTSCLEPERKPTEARPRRLRYPCEIVNRYIPVRRRDNDQVIDRTRQKTGSDKCYDVRYSTPGTDTFHKTFSCGVQPFALRRGTFGYGVPSLRV